MATLGPILAVRFGRWFDRLMLLMVFVNCLMMGLERRPTDRCDLCFGAVAGMTGTLVLWCSGTGVTLAQWRDGTATRRCLQQP